MSESADSDGDADAGPEIAAAVAIVAENLRVALGSVDRVQGELEFLERRLVTGAPEVAMYLVHHLLPLVGLHHSAVALLVFELFERRVACFPQPLRVVLGLLDTKDEELQRRAAGLAPQLAALGCAVSDPEAVDELAGRGTELPGVFGHPTSLLALGSLLEGTAGAAANLLSGATGRRRLAARMLDAQGLPDHTLACRVLGRANADALRPYLDFTRATHLDLVVLTPRGPGEVPCLASLLNTSRVLAQGELAQLVGQLGWARVCWGVSIERITGVSVAGGLPYRVDTDLAVLFDDDPAARRQWNRLVLIAEGDSGSNKPPSGSAEVTRFRRYNTNHAELLEAILEIAPLTRAKAEFILHRMAGVVEDFEHLFGRHTADGVAAREKYRCLKDQIASALRGDATTPQSSATTRLVQMFEEPRSVDEVTTLHGLKRYLHQRGLRLVFRLFGAAAGNRTIDLVVMDAERGSHIVQVVRYVDFEPERDRPIAGPPLAVALVVEAFVAHLVHGGTARLPTVDVLAYGNEVQIYLHYFNHPAFLRLDLSSPRHGGMLDLAYFAVSQTELGDHPDLEVPAIRRLLANLDFDVERDSLHLRVRYDKERAIDVEDLIEHVRYLLAVTPYLMDLDWTMAGLDYPASARAEVVDAWTRYITHHGVLPLQLLLTGDRRKIWQEVRSTPTGMEHTSWDGTMPYRDRYTAAGAETRATPLASRLERALAEHGLDRLAAWGEARGRLAGQRLLERVVLSPLRDAMARGELSVVAGDLVLADQQIFRREHEAVRLARLVAAGGAPLGRAIKVARVVERLERFTSFQVTGAVQGRAVERALLPWGRRMIGVFVLRDEAGRARAAVAAEGGVLYEHRSHPTESWQASRELEPEVLAHAWLDDDADHLAEQVSDIDELRRLLSTEQKARLERSLHGEQIWPALVIAPGRASGFVRFLNPRMQAKDVAEAVLVAPAFRPEHAPLIARAAGLLSTGGGILSHAGVTALELGIPALAVDASWSERPAPRLVRQQVRYADEQLEVEGLGVTVRREVGETLDAVEEGDLVVLGAYSGRLTVLGQDPDALAIFRELGNLELGAAATERAGRGPEVLAERGRLLQCVHQLGKLLSRVTSPNVARYAARALALPRGSGDVRAAWPSVGMAHRARLLARLLENPACGQIAAEELARTDETMRMQLEQLARDALAALPLATNVFQIGGSWLRVLRFHQALVEMHQLLVAPAPFDATLVETLASVCRARLAALAAELACELARELGADEAWRIRHVLRALEQVTGLTGSCDLDGAVASQARHLLAAAEAERRAAVEHSLVISDGEGGVELAPLIGTKAANLGEMGRILGSRTVPRWAAVADLALQRALDQPAGREGTLGVAMRRVLTCPNTPLERQAEDIARLWAEVELPAGVRAAIVEAYQRICAETPASPVAVRSSAFEEDSEQQPWAGQFATFLGVSGEDAVVEHVRRVWASLWSKSVLARRQQLGMSPETQTRSGVVLQRMVEARVSGVIFTASPAARARQMVLNVGLGLGEGVVSGLAEVDLVLIDRPSQPDRPLELEYKAADKRHQVVLAPESPRGTRVADVAYHRRFRPALESVEIEELVAAALQLEHAFRQPLDIEFAFEGADLRILQARPVPVFHAALSSPLLGQAVRAGSHQGGPL